MLVLCARARYLQAVRRAAIAMFVVMLLALAAAVGAASAATGRVAYRELASGSRGSNLPGERLQPVARVLRSRSAATRVLRGWGLDAAAVRGVDFGRQSLLVVLAEYQPSAGYRARVADVGVRGRQAIVTTRVRYEGGDIAASDLERPWVVVAVKRSDLVGVRSEARVRRG
jgi:hypothetical protein